MAVLSRETALLVVALLALERPLARSRRPASWTGAARAVAPGASTVDRDGDRCPHLVDPARRGLRRRGSSSARLATGSWPLLTSGQRTWTFPSPASCRVSGTTWACCRRGRPLLWFGELFILVVVVVAAALALRTTTARLYERAAWVAYGVVALTLAPGIWLGDVGFRSLDDLYVFSCIILLSSPRRLTVPAVLVAGGWTVVAVELVRFI